MGSLVCHLPLCSRSQYQLGGGGFPPCCCVCGRGALIVSVGKKQECVPACCIVLRYKFMNLLFVLGDDGYLHERYYPAVSRDHPGCLGASCCVIL